MKDGWRPAEGPVVCIGETMAALAPGPSESLETAEDLRVSVAGAESNVAMYLADLGIPVSWLSALGDDALGRRVLPRSARRASTSAACDPTRNGPRACS